MAAMTTSVQGFVSHIKRALFCVGEETQTLNLNIYIIYDVLIQTQKDLPY